MAVLEQITLATQAMEPRTWVVPITWLLLETLWARVLFTILRAFRKDGSIQFAHPPELGEAFFKLGSPFRQIWISEPRPEVTPRDCMASSEGVV